MEYNAGRLLDSKLGLKISNAKPHSLEPLYFCKQYLQVMNKHNISKTENSNDELETNLLLKF